MDSFAWRQAQSLSHVRLLVTLWTATHQAPLSMEFSRQEYWSGCSFPSPGDLPDSGIEPASPVLADVFFTTGPPGKSTDSFRIFKKYVFTVPTLLPFFRFLLLTFQTICSSAFLVYFLIFKVWILFVCFTHCLTPFGF